MYLRRASEAASAGRSRLASRNGAVTLHSCTSSSSSASTEPRTWVQLFSVTRSGTSPPASIAVPAAMRSRRGRSGRHGQGRQLLRGDGAASVPARRSPGRRRPPGCADGPPGRARPPRPRGRRCPAELGGQRHATRRRSGGGRRCPVRRTVCAALLIRMSSGPSAAVRSARATTWEGSRRSMPTMRSRCSQSALSGSAAKRRAASRGKRVVMVVCAPSRSRRRAMCMPIFARPPVSRARRPVRSARASRRSRPARAQSGHRWW